MGSNEIITDEASLPHEFHLTLPFGETMVEQRKPMSDYYNSWKFTGKELDGETGLYYFVARYYQPSWSIWLSVDPLLEEFPTWTPYHYVHNNPVILIDPDGKKAFDKGKGKGKGPILLGLTKNLDGDKRWGIGFQYNNINMNAQFEKSLKFQIANIGVKFENEFQTSEGLYNSFGKASSTLSFSVSQRDQLKYSFGSSLTISSSAKNTFKDFGLEAIEKSFKDFKSLGNVSKIPKQDFVNTDFINGLNSMFNDRNNNIFLDTSRFSGLESNAIDFTDPNRGPIREPDISNIENVFQNTKDIRRYFDYLFKE